MSTEPHIDQGTAPRSGRSVEPSTDPLDPAATDAADLVDVVTAVPGVAGLEPGVATTLRTLDARLRRSDPSAARYGLVLDRDRGEVTVEISLSGPLPLRSVVEEVQRAVQRAVAGNGAGSAAADSTAADSTEAGSAAAPHVLVRVQSLARP